MASRSRQSVKPTEAICRLLPPPLYGGAVVALAIFFIGLAVVTPSIERHIVSTEIAGAPAKALYSGGGEGIDDGKGGVAKVGSQHIAAAARAACFQTRAGEDTGSIPRLTLGRLRKISERLDLAAANEGGEEQCIALTFQDPDLQWAKAFVDDLAQRLVREWNRLSHATPAMEGSIRKAKWHVQQARHYERKARFDMEQSLNAHFERLRSVVDQTAGRDDSRGPGQSGRIQQGETRGTSARKENPQWRRLREELGARRGEGAGTTAVKPATASGQSQTGGAVAYAWAQESDGGGEGASLVPADYRRLRNRYTEAIRRREAAERGLSELEAMGGRETSQAPAHAAHIPRSAVSVGQLGGVPPAGPVLTLGTLALLCGAFVYGWITTLGRVPRIYSAEQLQTAAGLPLVGRISIEPMPSRVRRRAYWSWGVRGSIRASEIVLLAVILIFFWSVLQESPVLDQWVTNPLGTIANRVSGVYRG
ncbi:MAG: hypothetical protein ACQESR_09350 [Planctomycetota bacterium]